ARRGASPPPADKLAGHGKYALHVWCDAASEFGEPFQPLLLAQAGEKFDRAPLQLGKALDEVKRPPDNESWTLPGYEVFLPVSLSSQVESGIVDYTKTLTAGER